MSDLNARQKDAVTTLLGRMPENRPVALDPSDPNDRAAIDLFLDLSNKGGDRYPGLHDALGRAARNGGTSGGAPVDQPTVVDLGRDRAGRATASTWVGAPGMPFVSGAGTLVMDAGSHDPLAFGTATNVGESLVQVGTDPATARAGTGRQTVLTISHAQASADEAPRFGAVQRTVTAFDYTGPPAKVNDPTVQPGTGNPYPYIGLGRQAGYNSDCDYTYIASTNVTDPPPLFVPFTGSVTLPYNITGIENNGQITGLSVTSQIYVALSQTGISAATNLTPAGCMASKSALTVLNWSYPFNATALPTPSIAYAAAGGAQATESAFYFQFSIPVDAPDTPYIFTVCSKGTPHVSTQCCNIDNLYFVWHCLAADTQVTRADGTPARIGDLDNTVRVRTGIGDGDGSLAVEATWRGTHARMVRLSTDSGHSLLATHGHPVMTPVGLVAAGELRPGTHVMLEGGRSTPLSAVEEVEYGGEVWNLMLGNHEDRAAGRVGEAALFVANGIVVGDFNAQGRMYRNSRRNLDFMRARIPRAYHRDYESALADLRR